MNKHLTVKTDSLHLNPAYKDFLSNIKEKLKASQIRAALAANSELIKFYWQLGCDILDKQKAYAWGEKFLEQFSHDMHKEFPQLQGFSVRNLQRMRQFAQAYPDFSIRTQAVSQLPWGHITRLIQMVKDATARE